MTEAERTQLLDAYWRLRQLLFLPELTEDAAEACLQESITILVQVAKEKR